LYLIRGEGTVALPAGLKFVSVEHFGISAWTITGRIIALRPDESEQTFFLKVPKMSSGNWVEINIDQVAYGDHGGIMLKGEWESSKDIYKTMPGFLPEPFGFGRYKVQSPAIYFYLSEFVDMDVTSPPDPAEFTSKLTQLHKKSTSPTGKFGFQVVTCDGKMAHKVDWEDNWAVFYRNLLLGVCKLDEETNGPWPELERATKQVTEKVVPRLLGNLDIKPCLIHGDLWEGNMGIRMDTGESTLFDAGSYFAHNEMELGHWRVEFASHFRAEVYTRHYVQNYPAAEPVHEFDDRVRLYSLKAAINYSAGHPGSFLRTT
jgi:protein-ribulosamine 3-kinase